MLFHAHVNLLGRVSLIMLATLLTLRPTALRTRMADGAVTVARRALPIAVAGLTAVGIDVLAWWPPPAAGGLALTTAAALLTALPVGQAARRTINVHALIAISAALPGASWQRCRTHYLRNLTKAPKPAQPWIATLVRTIFDQPDADAVRVQLYAVADAAKPDVPTGREAAADGDRRPGATPRPFGGYF
ncbi:Transposase, Mutator family [Micromonospora citrea]|uniref:Transposase, Mutator family n=1 Tax=Micromonospora citrea TaxID=47855 RepID=A0A1C6U5S0_9ACTN|nr:Transposase, Mutator family [Micromonospora citrea]